MNPAFLAKLTVHGLTRSAQSSEMSDSLAAREGMSAHAVSVSQNLLPMQDLKDAGILSVAELISTQGQLSKLHRDNTLPWTNDGWRILPTLAYEKYNTQAHALIDKLHTLRSTVAQQWDPLILPVCRAAHRHRFRAELYPSATGILQRVSASLAYMPLSTDFRTEIIGEEVAARLSAQASDRLQRAVADSNRQIAESLITMIQALVATLENPKGKLYDSVFDNLKDFLNRMPALNLNNDPLIADLRQGVLASIQRLNPGIMRRNPGTKTAVASTLTTTITAHARRLSLDHLLPTANPNLSVPPTPTATAPARRLTIPTPTPELATA